MEKQLLITSYFSQWLRLCTIGIFMILSWNTALAQCSFTTHTDPQELSYAGSVDIELLVEAVVSSQSSCNGNDWNVILMVGNTEIYNGLSVGTIDLLNYVGQQIMVMIEQDGLPGMGFINVVDKLPPVIRCNDVEVNCSVDLDTLNTEDDVFVDDLVCTDVTKTLLGRYNDLENYVGPFNPANWTDNAGVFGDQANFIPNASGESTTLIITGEIPVLQAPGGLFTTVCVDINCPGSISFDWSLALVPGTGLFAPNFDYAAYSINGSQTQLSNNNTTSGSVGPLALVSGDQFCFELRSNTNPGFTEATYDNFNFVADQDRCDDYCFFRKWQATDCNGMSSTCYQTITVTRPPFTNPACPDNVYVSCDETDDWEFDPDTGFPLPESTGYPTLDGEPINEMCKYDVKYTDTELSKPCDAELHLLRDWVVLDCCDQNNPDNPFRCTQIIKVVDETAPLLECPEAQTVEIRNSLSCSATWEVPAMANLEDNCNANGDITITVYPPVPATWNPNSGGVYGQVEGLPEGLNTIRIEAQDPCGNVSTCDVEVTAIDKTPPTVVAIDFSIGVGIDGYAEAPAASFDNGSHDNCRDNVYFKIIRMDQLGATTNGTTEEFAGNCANEEDDEDDLNITGIQTYFDDEVKVCCQDVGTNIQVIFRVFDVDPGMGPVSPDRMNDLGQLLDEEGNCIGTFSDQMKLLEVLDKIAPRIVGPSSFTISCEFSYDINNLDASFGGFLLNPNGLSAAYSITDPGLSTDPQITYGSIEDNCSDIFTVRENTPVEDLDDCGNGTITREYDVLDNGPNVIGTFNQVITIVPSENALEASDIDWPEDITITLDDNTCTPVLNYDNLLALDPSFVPQTDPEDWTCNQIPKPDLNIIRDYDSGLGAGLCNKIEVEWALLDWCGENRPTYTNTSFIIIEDPVGPTWTNSPADLTVSSGSNAQLTAGDVSDNCTTIADNEIEWCIEDASGSVVASGTGKSVDEVLSDGEYLAIFKAIDECNNEGRDTIKITVESAPCTNVISTIRVELDGSSSQLDRSQFLTNPLQDLSAQIAIPDLGIAAGDPAILECNDLIFTSSGATTTFSAEVSGLDNTMETCPCTIFLLDIEAPELELNTGLSFAMDDNCTKTLLIDDIVSSTSDNCGGNVYTSFAPFTTTSSLDADIEADRVRTLTITETELASGTNGIIDVIIYARDQSGRGRDESTLIEFTDPVSGGTCANTALSLFSIAGKIINESGEPVEDVQMILTGDMEKEQATGGDGNYLFDEVPVGKDYVIQASKENDVLNGVSTYDMVLISQHIRGIRALDSPFRMIAADVNKSGSITAYDIVDMRKQLLFITPTFPNNASWRFIDAGYDFPVDYNPFTTSFPELYNIDDLQSDMDIDFVAVKTGDVDGSSKANATDPGNSSTRSAHTEFLSLENRNYEAGEIVEIPVKWNGNALLGYQMTWNWNPGELEFIEVISNHPGLGQNNFGSHKADEGILIFSWHQASPLQINDLFTLKFRATRPGSLSGAISLSEDFLNAEAYTELGVHSLDLEFNSKDLPQFELLQNRPNPFSDHTVIGYHVPQSVIAELVLYDASGKNILRMTSNANEGYNEFVINATELPHKGIWYYQLKAGEHSATRTLTILD